MEIGPLWKHRELNNLKFYGNYIVCFRI